MGSHSWKIPPLCEVLFASGNWGLITEVPTPSPPTSIPHPTAAAERGRPRGKTAALTWVPRSVVPFTLQVELRWLTAVVLTCLVKGNTQVYFLTFYLLILERKERREREININLFHLFIHSLVNSYMCPNWGIKPTTLAYWDDALTNWATWLRFIYIMLF